MKRIYSLTPTVRPTLWSTLHEIAYVARGLLADWWQLRCQAWAESARRAWARVANADPTFDETTSKFYLGTLLLAIVVLAISMADGWDAAGNALAAMRELAAHAIGGVL